VRQRGAGVAAHGPVDDAVPVIARPGVGQAVPDRRSVDLVLVDGSLGVAGQVQGVSGTEAVCRSPA